MVTVIILIIASMLLPALQEAKESANRSVCVNNLKQTGIVFGLYSGDYEDRHPPSQFNWYPTQYGYDQYWYNCLYVAGYFSFDPTVSDLDQNTSLALVCPSGDRVRWLDHATLPSSMLARILRWTPLWDAVGGPLIGQISVSYTANSSLGSLPDHRVEQPEGYALIYDHCTYTGSTNVVRQHCLYNPVNPVASGYYAFQRHRQQVQILQLDGHVQTYKMDQAMEWDSWIVGYDYFGPAASNWNPKKFPAPLGSQFYSDWRASIGF